MYYQISAIGRFKNSPEKLLFESYKKRLKHSLILKEMEEKRPTTLVEKMTRESILLEESLPKGAFKIILDEAGEMPSSKDFAKLIQNWQDLGYPVLAFLIGGAEGHSSHLKKKGDYHLSLGKLTWPHMMVRILLIEQLFRAESILNNHPYHRA